MALNPKFIFFGTPLFAVRVLSRLVSRGYLPLAVVTNPDRPMGRKQIITPSAVKMFIKDLPANEEVRVLSPEKLDEIFIKSLKELKPDLFVVAAYGRIIPREVLAVPPLGVIGVHPSLLPRYRGASPIQSVLLAGEHATGVSLYMLDEKMDAGPVIAQKNALIQLDETYETLSEKLANAGGELLLKIMPDLESAKTNAETQDEARATYTKKFKTEDAYVEPGNLRDAQNGVSGKNKAAEVYRKIQALNPEPGVWTMQNGKRVKLLKAKLDDDKLKLTITQIEGKKPQIINES